MNNNSCSRLLSSSAKNSSLLDSNRSFLVSNLSN